MCPRKYEDFYFYPPGSTISRCLACLKNIKRTADNSTGMKRHLERVHPELASMVQTDGTDYQVERILDRRVVGCVVLYLVHWRGWPVETSTWEPLSHLAGAAEAIVDFEALQAGFV